MAVIGGFYQPNRLNNSSGRNQSDMGRHVQGNGESGMSNTAGAYQKYQQNSVNMATPQELTLMLYNGLVRFLKLACQGIDEQDVQKSNTYNIRSQDIISEFMRTLDAQYEISNGLMPLYDYMNRRLIEANVKKDKAILEEVLGYAEELRDTWAQAMKIAKQQVVNK